jgi:hypothetical protein
MNLLIAAVATFVACFVLVPAIFWLLRFFGVYAIVEERTCNVYVLFGKVVAILDEPGLHILLFKLGLQAPIVSWLGRLYVLDMRIDQQYLRSQPVNSEEGAPMGIGIWYEMFISDPVAFLFNLPAWCCNGLAVFRGLDDSSEQVVVLLGSCYRERRSDDFPSRGSRCACSRVLFDFSFPYHASRSRYRGRVPAFAGATCRLKRLPAISFPLRRPDEDAAHAPS